MRPLITPNMRIRDILTHHPQAVAVLHAYGIRCEGCHAARYESLGQGAQVHGIELGALLTELNSAVRSTPVRRPRDHPLSLIGN